MLRSRNTAFPLEWPSERLEEVPVRATLRLGLTLRATRRGSCKDSTFGLMGIVFFGCTDSGGTLAA